MQTFTRPVRRRHPRWHPQVCVTGGGGLRRGGSPVLALNGPAGLVGPVGSTDHPYAGMDPSDPTTWTRPYRPAAGMIAMLNFDGAQPNTTQTTGPPGRWRRR